MKRPGTAINHAAALIIGCFLLTTNLGAAATSARSNDEPFRTFGLLDGKLSLLQSQQQSLRAALAAGGSDSGKRPWSEPAGALLKTAISVGQITTRAEQLYKLRHRPNAVKVFRALQTKVGPVRSEAIAIQSASNREAARADAQKLNEAVLSLVFQFQAISGGYAATRCAPREWACCEPKRSNDLRAGEEVACRWMCVQHSQRCTGLLGPRIR